jgi:hypothetical protein
MARGGKERVEWQKTCRACGRTGTVIYGEAASPPHQGPPARSYDHDLVGAGSPFKVERSAGSNIVRCECGQEIV